MNQQINIIALIKEKIGTIVLGAVFVAAASFLFLIISQKSYKVTTSYLILQNQSASQDFYTLSKSAEYLGKVLNEAVYSELFIDEVVRTNRVKAEFLPFDKKEKIKSWSQMVRVNRNAELGIISVEIYNDNQKDAGNIALAVSDVLTTKNSLFRGDGQSVEVKILSGPIVEKNPSFINIVTASLGGFIFGLLIMLILLYYREREYLKKIYL
jgi:capsular polysaccharide biosynthesis protein